MKTKQERCERYLRDPAAIQIGGIAANLSRIGAWASDPRNDRAVADMLYETKLFIEWAAPVAPVELAASMVRLQVSLATWQARWSSQLLDVALRDLLAQFARNWSDKLLKNSGLLPETFPAASLTSTSHPSLP